MKQRPVLSLLAAVFSGFVVGIASDFFAGGVDFTFDDIVSALMLSPALASGAGSAAVDVPFWNVFTVGGCLFWPMFGVLAWQWFRSKRTAFLVALFLWSAQGCFQILHRFEAVMSI